MNKVLSMGKNFAIVLLLLLPAISNAKFHFCHYFLNEKDTLILSVDSWHSYSIPKDDSLLNKYGCDTTAWKVLMKNNAVYAVINYSIKDQDIADGLFNYDSVPIAITKTMFKEYRIIMRSGKGILTVDDGFLIGINKGEFGAALLWFSKDGKKHYKISDHQVVGFIRRAGKIYAVEGLAHLSVSEGSMIEIAKTRDKWLVHQVLRLPAAPVGVALDSKGNFIVGTSDGLDKIDEYGNREPLVEKAFWQKNGYLYPENLIIKEDIVYIGMRKGIFKYNLNTKKQEWLMRD